MKNKSWLYYGNGLESLGEDGSWKERDIPEPGDDELLARVDAVAICASDVKMIRMGNDYPLFKNRDFANQPAVLGHELSLTVVKAGKNLQKDWKPGQRLGVQPDVYMDSVRYCIGVNVEGGFQQYLILGKSVFHSDHGVTVFPVPDSLSCAAVALLEPNACVEAAYRKFTRTAFSPDKEMLLYIAENATDSYELDIDWKHDTCVCVNDSSADLKTQGFCTKVADLAEALGKFSSGPEDVLILGNPPAEVLERILGALARDAVFCWLVERKTDLRIRCDIAQIHYSNIFFTGTPTHRLSDAFREREHRFSLKREGDFLVVGGAGAMGRMHVLRAIMDPEGPSRIVVIATRLKRLKELEKAFYKTAKEKGKELYLAASAEDPLWEQKVRALAPDGYDDVLICAPGIPPVDEGTAFLKKGGKLILFSGTSYGNRTWLPMGDMASCHTIISASSGSGVEDEKTVLKRMAAGELNPNRNIMAIAGLKDVKKAIEACGRGDYPGKVIVYPQLETLPLTGLDHLDDLSPELAAYVRANGWDLQAEQYLMNEMREE